MTNVKTSLTHPLFVTENNRFLPKKRFTKYGNDTIDVSVHCACAGDGLLLRHDGSHNLEEQGSQQRRGQII